MILVTGGTGLVGSHLLYELVRSGERVRALYREGSNLDAVHKIFNFYSSSADLFSKIEWVEGDMLDYFSLVDALKDISVVYHCAAMVSFKPSDADNMFAVNVEGTANLVNASIECKIRRFCYVSSIATLGKSVNGQLIDESAFWQNDDNHSVYSQSKFRAEMEVWRGTKEGLPAVIVNPGVIIGPGDTRRSSGRLITSLSKNMTFYTGGGNGFVDVRDVINAMVKICCSDIENERFIINGENISYKKLMDTAASVFDVKAPGIRAGRLIISIVWRIERLNYLLWRKHPRMTKETAGTSQNISSYSSAKLLNNFSFKFHSVEEALINIKEFNKAEK